jgi:hypothetical protein
LRDEARIRAKYRNYPPDVLGFSEPIAELETSVFLDGGTETLRFTNANGDEFRACLDGRLFKNTNHVYVEAEHPDDSGAKAVAIGGPEECALYGLLIRWHERDPRLHEVEELDGESARAWFLRSENRDFTATYRLLRRFDHRFANGR